MEANLRRNFPGMNVKDIKGMTVPFVFNNGVTLSPISLFNYNPKTQPEGFFIIPLTAGEIEVQLFGQTDSETFIIDSAEVTAYAGMPLPYRCKKIVSGAGTTVTSLQIVW